MKPMSVIQRLNESDNNRIDITDFGNKLLDILNSKGFDTILNGDCAWVFIETDNGRASLGVQFYEANNNVSDFEVNTIGLGGDTPDEISVFPLVKDGWDQENGDPRGIQKSSGTCYAMFQDIDKTTPEEVADIIKRSFDYELDENKNESSLEEANRYSDIEDNDPILDKTIKVYDINALIDKEVNKDSEEQYQAFDFGQGAAIIIKSDGSGCIVDYEGVGSSFNSTSEEVQVDVCPKDGDDGNGHRTIHIMPTASFKATIDELLKAPSKDMKVRDFFEKYNYNDRCARNFENLIPYLTEGDKLNESSSYSYIDTSEMDDCVYNSLSNTDVISMLSEIQKYFNESIPSIEKTIKNASHDPGMSNADIEACKFGSEKIEEILKKFEDAWQ